MTEISWRSPVKLLTILTLVVIMIGCRSTEHKAPPPPVPSANQTEEAWSTQSPQPIQVADVEFDSITLEDGLSQSTILDILQDSQGFMWFATADGLNRYDGYKIDVFKHDPADPYSLSENHITSLYEDSNSTLWVGTEGGGLARFNYDTGQFIHYRHDPNNPGSLSSDIVTTIHEDKDGYLWVGTSFGLNKFDPKTERFTVYINSIGSSNEAYGSNYVTAVHDTKAGSLWIGTLGGLLSFDLIEETFSFWQLARTRLPRIPEGQQPVKVGAIHEDESGVLWIGTLDYGLFKFEPSLGKVTNYPHHPDAPLSLSHSTVRAVIQDQSDVLWVGTDHGLDMRDPNSNRFYHFHQTAGQSDSLTDESIMSLYLDEAGLLWVGTRSGGINKLDPFRRKFLHVSPEQDDNKWQANSDNIWSFYEDKDGYLWIGTDSELTRWDRASRSFDNFLGPGNWLTSFNGQIKALLEDHSGYLWIGTHEGLIRFDPDRVNPEFFRHDSEDVRSLSSNLIESLYEDSLGNLWIGTSDTGIDRFDEDTGSFTHYEYVEADQPTDILGQNVVTGFLEDQAGRLWATTLGGLAQIDRSAASPELALKYYRHEPANPDSLSHDIVNAIHEDQEGNLWLGTAFGLDMFDADEQSFTHFRESDGLPNNMVLGILEDKMGNLWLSTNRGLSQFDPQSRQFQNYDTRDGLQALEFNRGAQYKSPSGEMFFGGINGFNVFNPDNISSNPYRPHIVITDFQIFNKSISPGPESRLDKPINRTRSITLDRQDTVFSFELAALHYSAPEQNRYAYIMEGFDEEWNLVDNRRYATYTNLPPGTYTFRAIGTNSDGVWNTEGTTLEIIMPFPFWRTWWFLGVAIIGLVVVILGAFRLRTRNIAARTRELEMLVAERTSEIERRRLIAEGLREILVILNSDRSLLESLHYIVSQAARLTDAEDAIIIRLAEYRDRMVQKIAPRPAMRQNMVIVATNPGGQIRYSPGEALVTITQEWIAKQLPKKEPVVIADLAVYWQDHPNIHPKALGSHQALLGIPLFLGEELYGGLLMFYLDQKAFTSEDLELGFTFADQAALAIANNQLREQAEQMAVASERSRLARDLHDAVTQTLFSASLIAETLPHIWQNDPGEGRQLLQELRQLTRGALAEMRTLLLELRPAALEEAQLPDLLYQLAEAVSGRTGIPVKADADCPKQLPPNVRVALYRIAQESLNNVVKHARANHVELDLRGCSDGNGVILTIRDDGRGFDPQNVSGDHLGLNIIRERAQAIQASLSLQSKPGNGTSVMVTWEQSDQKSLVTTMHSEQH